MKRITFPRTQRHLFKEFIIVWRDPMTLVLHVFSAAGGDDRVRLRARYRRETHGDDRV